jgi:hypothetical protein
MKTIAAITSVNQGTRNIPAVDTIFAAVNCMADIGRLIKNGSVCFFLSLMMFEGGSMHPNTMITVKNRMVPKMKGTSPPT